MERAASSESGLAGAGIASAKPGVKRVARATSGGAERRVPVAWLFRRLVIGSGASVLFSLSALFVVYGLARVVAPLLARDGALREPLLCLGAINAYELALLAATALLVLWRKQREDAVLLVMLAALFLVVGGMMLGVPAADHPEVVTWLGLACFSAGVVKIEFLRRGLGVPMSTAMRVGQGLLLAWNFLAPAHLAWQLRTLNGAGLPVAEGMRIAWQWGWWLMLAGTGCLVAASIGKDAGHEREAASVRCFFNHSLMGWLFSGLLLAACVVHQRVLCYTFSIRCYDADFLPIAVAAPIIALGLLRRYRTCPWALEALLGMLPLTMVAYVMGRLASPASAWLSVGILWQPMLLLGVAAVLLVIEGWRHRSPVLPYLLVAYGVAGILLAGVKPGSPLSLNWEWAVGGAVLAMIAAGLWRRQPWTAAVGLLVGTVGALNSSRVESLLTHGHMNPVPTLLALFGLILLSWYFYFGRTYPRRLADVGALLVAAFAMFAYDGQHFGTAMAVVGVSIALLGGAVAWRFGNLPIGFLLSLPLAFCVLFSFRKMTDWHFVGIGFLLLALGTAFSLWKQTINKLLRLVFFRYRRQVMGRPRNGQPKGADNTLLVVLTLLFIVIFLAGMLLPALSMSRGKARQISCASNLKQIGLALRMYSSDWGGQFPPEDGAAGLERLRQQGYLENAKMFTCPSTSTKACDGEPLTEETVDYGYRGGLSEGSPLDTPLAWDKPDNHVKYGNVLYVDGHVSGESGRDWRERAERP